MSVVWKKQKQNEIWKINTKLFYSCFVQVSLILLSGCSTEKEMAIGSLFARVCVHWIHERNMHKWKMNKQSKVFHFIFKRNENKRILKFVRSPISLSWPKSVNFQFFLTRWCMSGVCVYDLHVNYIIVSFDSSRFECFKRIEVVCGVRCTMRSVIVIISIHLNAMIDSFHFISIQTHPHSVAWNTKFVVSAVIDMFACMSVYVNSLPGFNTQ